MRRTRFDDLADRLRQMARDQAVVVAPAIERMKVTSASPLIVEDFEGELMLEEGDPDAEFDRALLTDGTRPAVGDTVRVHRDAHGDWIVSGIIDSGGGA